MANSTKPVRRRGGRAWVPPTLMLAFWRLRKTWGLLLVTGVGMIAAVMLVCSVPLYSQVSMTAGLRSTLNAAPQNADLLVYSVGELVSIPIVSTATYQLDQEFEYQLGPYIQDPQFSAQTGKYYVETPTKTAKGISYIDTINQLQLVGASIQQATPHVKLLSGRLPLGNSQELEVALPPDAATGLTPALGTIMYVGVPFDNGPLGQVVISIPVHVVGIFSDTATNDPFWHQIGFKPVPRGPRIPGSIFTGIVSNDVLLSLLSNISKEPKLNGLIMSPAVTYYWYYRLDANHIGLGDLDAIDQSISSLQLDVSNNIQLMQSPFLEQTKTILPTDTIEQYKSRVPVAQIPVTSLLFLMLGLVLFFVSLMSNLVVDRQADAIAVLRSRGASRGQIFGAFATQGVGLGIIALVVGPLLAYFLVIFISQQTLSAADQSALNIITNDPVQALLNLRWYPIVAVLVSILAMILSIIRSTSRDVLSMRRESSRSTRRPLWQRLNLDVVAAIIMIVGYGFSVYLNTTGVLDPHLQLLLLTPMTLVGSVFLVLAFMLLFLRFFPSLLRFGSSIAARSRGAAPLLALAQMARAPHQAVRMTLLLALAIAFAIFTLVFTSSQAQRVVDVSGYQGGADFSGTLAIPADQSQLDNQTMAFSNIPGVTSATVGYTGTSTASFGKLVTLPTQIMAVDASTFAKTAIWTPQDSSQPLSALMEQLNTQRAMAITEHTVPAIVDAATWNRLNLTINRPFRLTFSDGIVNFVAVAEVDHIPTLSDVGGYSSSSLSTATTGGILVDYRTYANVYLLDFQSTSGTAISINYAWLRTKSDASSLANVRHALGSGLLQLAPLNDRRAAIASLQADPLYQDLIVILAMGAITALLLALVGNLIASWLSAHGRLTNFAVMRALGTAPRQIASVLTWEQSIIYAAGLLLGVVFGTVLSALMIPALVFTSVGSNGAGSDVTSAAFYVVQNVPPVQIVVPVAVWLVLVVLVVICVSALWMMVRVVSKPSMSQTLRLNED